MCIVPLRSSPVPRAAAPARGLTPPARQQLVLDALAGQPITDLARQQQVSRKFVYQQLQHAHQALDQALAPSLAEPPELLFWLPVTKPWLRQLVLGLTLLCHSSLRGVSELLADLFDYPLSVGSVHNSLRQAVGSARQVTGQQDLGGIRIGAHDEIFQAGRPVLVGADVASTYCYLLSPEEHRDADPWGVRLLELADRGFRPQATIADFGGALRAAQAQVLPGVPCRGDVFHVLNQVVPLVSYLENRAYQAIAACTKLQHRQVQHGWHHGRKAIGLSNKLRCARPAQARAVTLADEVALRVRWLREEVLAVSGPDHATRCQLYDWLVAELRAREGPCPRRRAVRTLLQNQRATVLAFTAELDGELAAVAGEFAVPVATVRALRHRQALPATAAVRWQRQSELCKALGERYWPLHEAVAEVAAGVVRASSVIANLNSRLRSYFFLRRQVGPAYLGLLQFFLNHRRFRRSGRPERVGKSPAALRTGAAHPHWLELLGYQRFSRN